MEPHPRTSRMPASASPGGDASAAFPGRAPVDPTLSGTLLGGRYRIGDCIGTGAMGVVWTAWDQRLRRTVALKQLVGSAAARHADPADPTPARLTRARTLREGRIAARVVHPRAIAVFDVVVPDGEREAPWLVMEYLPSRSLAAVLTEHGPLEPGQAAHIGAQIADALAAVHDAGIVHGDVKPGNVLIGADGIAKITDFGVSRASWDTTATAGGAVAGTPGYVAPEVARGEDPTAASDMFSLGATLYAAVEGELVCGSRSNQLAVLHAMAEGRLRPATRAGTLGRPLAAMLRLGAEHRPDMAEIHRALRARATDVPIPDGPAGAPAAGSAPVIDTGEEHRDVAPVAVVGPPEPTPTRDPGNHDEPAVLVPAARSRRRGTASRRGSTSRRDSTSRPGGGGRVVVVAATAAVVLGLGAGITIAGPQVLTRLTGNARHTTTAAAPTPRTPTVPVAAPRSTEPTSQPTAEPTTGPAVPTSSAPAVGSASSDPSAPVTADDVTRTVTGYYDALPADLDAAWATLSDQARQDSGGYDGYARFWRGISGVSVDDVQVDGTSAVAQITFVTADGRTSREAYRFEVGRGDDGRLQIVSARRGGSSST